jgi:hypothetical protein
MHERLFFHGEAVQLTGVHSRTLDWYVKQGILQSSGADAHGTGSRRMYSKRTTNPGQISGVSQTSEPASYRQLD